MNIWLVKSKTGKDEFGVPLGRGCSVFKYIARGGLFEVKFEHRIEGGEGMRYRVSGGRVFQAGELTTSAQTLRWDCVWHI